MGQVPQHGLRLGDRALPDALLVVGEDEEDDRRLVIGMVDGRLGRRQIGAQAPHSWSRASRWIVGDIQPLLRRRATPETPNVLVEDYERSAAPTCRVQVLHRAALVRKADIGKALAFPWAYRRELSSADYSWIRIPRRARPLTLSLAPRGGEGIDMAPSPSERERVGVRVRVCSRIIRARTKEHE